MSYSRIAATAEAKRWIEAQELKDRAERAMGGAGARMMGCGVTCQEWLDIYLKRDLPATVVEHNTESEHDDQDRREATGTEAGAVSVAEGVGDAPGEQGGSKAQASWIDEAYPESLNWTEGDPLPF